MLPDVSKLSLNDKKCVPCMTPVHFKDRDQQYADHMASFVFQPTLERQIETAECELCMEPLGLNTSNAPPRTSPLGSATSAASCWRPRRMPSTRRRARRPARAIAASGIRAPVE